MHGAWVRALGALVWAGSAACGAQPVEFGGQVRLQWTDQHAATTGPLAQANTLQSRLVAEPDSGATLESELRARGHGVTAVATLQQHVWQSRTSEGKAWVNELYGSHDGGAWQFSAGKKIVSWDVGNGFRPNDMVQQEERRTLVTTTPEGRPVLMGEYFGADTAWSMVAVNPTGTQSDRGPAEPALAVRAYLRQGAADWHAFARVGKRTGGSVGMALAWVASDALELHSSMRYYRRIDTWAIDPQASGLVAGNPWQARTGHDVRQLVVGGTWTHASQVSLLAEAWWDGTAASDAQWNAWAQRNAQLSALAALGAPAAAVAGNLAWQAEAFSVSPSLRRSNVLLRLSWQNGAWAPALDVLYTPADQGHVVTGSLIWQGDRVQLQGGVRVYGGPANAVMAQLHNRQTAYVATTWSF